MKKNIIIFALIHLLILTVSFSAWTQSQTKTFTKSFNTDGISSVEVNLPGTVEIKPWDGANLRFEISVSLPNAAMIDRLASVGRYNLSCTLESGLLVVDAPNLQRQVKVKDQEIKESLHFLVLHPRHVAVVNANQTGLVLEKKK
jgi:hypothetical protein